MKDGPASAPLAAGDDLYRRLVEADAGERTREVLRLLSDRPGPLELPAHGGTPAVLNGIGLSRQRLGEWPGSAPRWNAERQAVDLCHADLRGASLKQADLAGVLLEEANLAGADLAGADLGGTDLAGADLQGALLEETNLRNASLRFARGQGCILEGAHLQNADLWGADFAGAVLERTDLRAARLAETNLRGANLAHADLRGAILERTDLTGADLTGADLQGARLARADLTGCILRGAKLQALDLTPCTLTHAHLADAWLERTRLERGQLGSALGEERVGEFELARKGYLALERNFEQLGDHDAAGWAYRRRRRMGKLEARRRARAARAAGRWREAANHYFRYGTDQFVEWLCNYGESIPRVLASLGVVYLCFALLYGATGSVVRVHQTPTGPEAVVTRHPLDLAVFSLLAMTTSGPPNGLETRHEAVYLLTGTQALLGVGLTGLLGFVIGNRIRR